MIFNVINTTSCTNKTSWLKTHNNSASMDMCRKLWCLNKDYFLIHAYRQTDTQYYLSSTSGFWWVPCPYHLGGASRLCGNMLKWLKLQPALHTWTQIESKDRKQQMPIWYQLRFVFKKKDEKLVGENQLNRQKTSTRSNTEELVLLCHRLSLVHMHWLAGLSLISLFAVLLWTFPLLVLSTFGR